MNNKKRKYIVLTWVFVFASLLLGKDMDRVAVDKVSKPSVANGPSQTVLNINNMAHWIKKNSAYTLSGSPNGCQIDYPIGTGAIIYADGMVWGAMVHDGGTQILRTGGTTYADGVKAGRVVFDAAGNVLGSTEPADHHAWRVRRDYKTADLATDAGNYFKVTAPSVASPAQMQEVYDQYKYDWNNWPASWGAPYDDKDSNGLYDPAIDIPGYPGADQTIWVVANDIPQIVDEDGNLIRTLNTTTQLYGADPIGMELQVTLWGYNYGGGDPLGNIVFKSAKLKYVGLPGGPADATMDKMFFSQWSDPDLGNATDDYVGCDIDLSLGFVYNGTPIDAVYRGIYNLPVPAAGYDFLKGPMVDGVPLGMTSFTYFGAGSAISDPTLNSYSGTGQFYNLMDGFLPRPEYPIQIPFTDLSTGEITKFVLSGDPIGGTGWVDGVQLPPGDRRLVMSSGPFEMKLGEEQEIVMGIIGGMGKDALTSLGVVKYYDLAAQYAFDVNFDLPSPPSAPQLNGFGKEKKIGLSWGSNQEAVNATELPISKGFAFEGYCLYQLPSLNAPLTEGVKVGNWDKVNGVTAVFDRGIDPSSGYIIYLPKKTGTNSGISYFYETSDDVLRGRPMSNGLTYYYALTAYSYKTDSTPDDPFVTIESSPARIAVVPHSMNPGALIPTNIGNLIDLTHDGLADISADVQVVDINKLTGDKYKIWYNQKHYYLDFDGNWKITAEPDAIAKLLDISPSTVTGVAFVAPPGVALVFEVHVLTTDYDCAQGALIELPAGAVITSVTSDQGVASAIQPDGSSVLFGDITPDGLGGLCGSHILTINVDQTSVAFPLIYNYTLYDDNWATLRCDPDGDGIVDAADVDYCAAYALGPGYSVSANAEGTGTIAELGYSFKTIQYWNLTNVTTGVDLLTNQWVLNGMVKDHIEDGVLYPETGFKYHGDSPPVFEGFIVDNAKGGYAAPVDFLSISFADGTLITDDAGHDEDADDRFEIDSYGMNSWAATAKSIDAYGAGFTATTDLQKDVKVVWDGVYGDPLANGYIPVVEGGSQVWIYNARSAALADHPSPENPGTGDPFLITVPFKVYDLGNAGDEPVQMSIIILDRIATFDGTYDGDDDGTPENYAFNPFNRMYCEFVKRPYAETLTDFASNEAFLTWNTVWWQSEHEVGDEIIFKYANPIILGEDELSWTTKGFSMGDVTQDDLDMIQVYPNPYYGFHEAEISRSAKYVSFNHLPQKATIRIFTIGGTMVRQIEKDDATQFARWDLANQYQYPVASGVYIIHIDTEYGEKILKLALVQETQVLKYY